MCARREPPIVTWSMIFVITSPIELWMRMCPVRIEDLNVLAWKWHCRRHLSWMSCPFAGAAGRGELTGLYYVFCWIGRAQRTTAWCVRHVSARQMQLDLLSGVLCFVSVVGILDHYSLRDSTNDVFRLKTDWTLFHISTHTHETKYNNAIATKSGRNEKFACRNENCDSSRMQFRGVELGKQQQTMAAKKWTKNGKIYFKINLRLPFAVLMRLRHDVTESHIHIQYSHTSHRAMAALRSCSN